MTLRFSPARGAGTVSLSSYLRGPTGATGATGATGPTGPGPSSYRETLTANRTYYVRTDGSDSNTGLVDTAGGAFLTLQKAWNTIAYGLDLHGFTVTVQIRDGTYSSIGTQMGDGPPGVAGSSSIVFQGNTSNKSSVVITGTTSAATIQVGDSLRSGTQVELRYFKITNSSTGSGLVASGSTVLFDNLEFGACTNGVHISIQHQSFVSTVTPYFVSGGAQYHAISATGSCLALHAGTITFSNSPTFSLYFLQALADASIFIGSNTFTNGGTVTNTLGKAAVSSNAYIDIASATNGVSYLPGTGSVLESGGKYGPRQRSQFANAAYSMAYGDEIIAQVFTLSAARTVTLQPVANMVPGQRVIVVDESGSATAGNKIVVAAQAGEFIGVPGVGFSASVDSVTQAFGSAEFSCNGGTWTKLR